MFTFKLWRRNNNFDKKSFATCKRYYWLANYVLWHMRSLLTSSCICINLFDSHFTYGSWFQIEVQYSNNWQMFIVGLVFIGVVATLMSSIGSPLASKFPSSSSRLRPSCFKYKKIIFTNNLKTCSFFVQVINKTQFMTWLLFFL